MPNASPVLSVKEIEELYTRNNFKALVDYFAAQNQLLGFSHMEYEATEAKANVKIAHGLGYIPKDIIMTKVVGAGTITFNYSLFDTTYLDVTFSAAARFRAFVGTYWQDQSVAQESSTQVQQVKASV